MLVLLSFLAASVTASIVTCDEFEMLAQRFEHEMKVLTAENIEMRERLARLEKKSETSGRSTVDVQPDGSMGNLDARRLQTGTSSYLVVDALQYHEFPNSAPACNNLDLTSSTYHKAMPLATEAGDVAWNPSPVSPTDEIILSKVHKDWTTTAIQRLQIPLKLVHGSGCGSAPSIRLNHNTDVPGLTVAGTMTVNGDLYLKGTNRPLLAFQGVSSATAEFVDFPGGSSPYYIKLATVSGLQSSTDGSSWANVDWSGSGGLSGNDHPGKGIWQLSITGIGANAGFAWVGIVATKNPNQYPSFTELFSYTDGSTQVGTVAVADGEVKITIDSGTNTGGGPPGAFTLRMRLLKLSKLE